MDTSLAAVFGLIALGMVIVAIVALTIGRRSSGCSYPGHYHVAAGPHGHDEAYAARGHDHDDQYSPLGHGHDQYAYEGHTHPNLSDAQMAEVRRIVTDELAARPPAPQRIVHEHHHRTEFIGRGFSRIAAVVGGLVGLGLALWSALTFTSSAVTGRGWLLNIAYTHGLAVKTVSVVLITVGMAAGTGWLVGGFLATRRGNDGR